MSAKKQDKFFVPFDHVTCPYEGCGVRGSIPGVKRHVKQIHGQEAYDNAGWPPLRTTLGLINNLEEMPAKQVDAIATSFGFGPDESLEDIAKAMLGEA